MQRILVIEDDTDINRLLCRILAKAGYETTAAYSGTEAQLRLERETPDMIMLDLMLPGISGEEIIKMARTEMGLQIPILVLSARTALKNKVETITLGADDYITKPFGMMEFISRVRAVLRRSSRQTQDKILRCENLSVNVDRHEVMDGQRRVELTLKEFEMLRYLMENQGIVLSRDRLLEHIWGYDFDGETRTVDVHIRTLRQKLGDCGNLIETIRGVGYRIGDGR